MRASLKCVIVGASFVAGLSATAVPPCCMETFSEPTYTGPNGSTAKCQGNQVTFCETGSNGTDAHAKKNGEQAVAAKCYTYTLNLNASFFDA